MLCLQTVLSRLCIYITIRCVLIIGVCPGSYLHQVKGRYTKKCILANKRYADMNGWPTNGTRGR